MLPASILIPVYNGESHIQQCLESAIAAKPIEIIVFDDCSTDKTRDLIADYPVKYCKSPNRVGAQSARNQLATIARAEWLQFMDADDYLLPQKLESQIDKALVSYTNFQVEKYVNRIHWKTYQMKTNTNDLLLGLMLYESLPPTGAFLFHRSIFNKIRWDESYKDGMHDRKITLDLLREGFNPVHIEHPGYVHRCGWNANQISSGEHYIESRRQFLSDLFNWIHGIESQTWRRFEYEKSLEGSC